jgi:hypothetical protein
VKKSVEESIEDRSEVMDPKKLANQGDELWKRSDKLNAEFFALSYGSLVVQLVKDYEDYSQVNQQLDKMFGHPSLYLHSPYLSTNRYHLPNNARALKDFDLMILGYFKERMAKTD